MHAPDTLEKKLYQVIISRLDIEYIHKNAYREKIFSLIKKGIGGFIIFGGLRTPTIGKVRSFISEMQSASDIPLFIASDIERGVGQQIHGATRFPCQMALSAAIKKNKNEDIRILEDVITAIGEEARYIGINMPLIPVMDVNRNPNNPIISTRAFSDNPKDVAWFGIKFIKILQGMGLICSAKHFPGHGDSSIDSHLQLPVIGKSYKDLTKVDIFPFIEAVKAGVKSIMVGHLSVPAIDSLPASLSRKIVAGLLREKLGFKGLALTDALNMGALKDIKDVSVRCIKAGVDILLHPENPSHTVKELMRAIKEKTLDASVIDIAVARILMAKAGLSNPPSLPFRKGELSIVNYKEHESLSRHISEMSVTLVKGKIRDIPIDKSKTHMIFCGDEELFTHSILKEHFKNTSEIKKTKTLKADITVFAVFTSVSAWKGTSGIEDWEKEKILKLIKEAKKSIVISFGSPYVLRDFKDADMLISAYEESVNAERAVMKCLKKKLPFKGSLPVDNFI